MISVTTDAVVFSPTGTGDLYVLLVTRKNDPFKGMLSLPGGFLNPDETLIDCAVRELREETGLDAKPILQMGERSEPDRDPRGRVISFPFIFTVLDQPEVVGSDDAEKAEWVETGALNPNLPDSPKLAFDHIDIIGEAMGAIIYDAITKAGLSPDLATNAIEQGLDLTSLELPSNATL